MLYEKKYDLVFGIGGACSCTQILRKCCLQFYSYPYDWLFGSDILTRAKILANNYENFLNYEDLEDTGQNNQAEDNLCENYHNVRNDITFNHDFKYGKPLSETYAKVKTKYDRRIQRLLQQIDNSKNVLAVYLQPPNYRIIVDDNTLKETHNVLKNRFPKQDITLLYLFCEHGKNDVEYKMIQENLIKITFDYDAYVKEIPYGVDNKVLQKPFCKLKITRKFMTTNNLCKRIIYLTKCFFRGML